MKKQPESTNDTPLIPFSEFEQVAKQVLSVSKEESDKRMAEFQKNNPNGKKNKKSKKAP